MVSTKNSITHPNQVLEIELDHVMESHQHMPVEFITLDQYNLMGMKDSFTMYIITDSPKHERYLGDIKLNEQNINHYTYYLTTRYDKNSASILYVIYVNRVDGIYRTDNMIELYSYNDANQAMNDLVRLNRSTHDRELIFAIEILLTNYYDKELDAIDCTTGILSLKVTRNHPDLQRVIRMTNANYRYPNKQMPEFAKTYFLEELRNFRSSDSNDVFTLYANIFDMLIIEPMKEYDIRDRAAAIYQMLF